MEMRKPSKLTIEALRAMADGYSRAWWVRNAPYYASTVKAVKAWLEAEKLVAKAERKEGGK
jgi:hypothetical protein